MAGLWRRFVCVASALAAGLLLTACNVVITEQPLFTAADAAPTPQLREGLWASADADCRFDASRPVAAWPKCAGGFLVRGSTVSRFDAETQRWEHVLLRNGRLYAYEADQGGWVEAAGVLLVAGDPIIAQMVVEAEDDKPRGYWYMALRPRSDDAGRVIEFSAWPVLCGPPPPPEQDEEGRVVKRMMTRAPFPGIVLGEDKSSCTTGSPESLRAAAVASEALAGETDEIHVPSAKWLRDGDR